MVLDGVRECPDKAKQGGYICRQRPGGVDPEPEPEFVL